MQPSLPTRQGIGPYHHAQGTRPIRRALIVCLCGFKIVLIKEDRSGWCILVPEHTGEAIKFHASQLRDIIDDSANFSCS